MRFSKYLTEAEFGQPIEWVDSHDHDSVIAGLQKIAHDCSVFLKNNSVPYYRGADPLDIDGIKHPITKIDQPVGRKSLGTGKTKTQIYNRLAKDAFGIHDWRGSSYFITSNEYMAVRFGRKHMVFPAGDYKALFSTKVEDIYEHFENTFLRSISKETGVSPSQLMDSLEGIVCGSEKEVDVHNYQLVLTTFKEWFENSNKFASVDGSGNEVAVYQGSGYWMIPLDLIRDSTFLNILGDIGALDIIINGTYTPPEQLFKYIRSL